MTGDGGLECPGSKMGRADDILLFNWFITAMLHLWNQRKWLKKSTTTLPRKTPSRPPTNRTCCRRFRSSNTWRGSPWLICWSILYRCSPRPFHSWRALLLRLFGAKMGPNCHFYPTSRVWAPWNLICEDLVTAGDGAEIYNPAPVHLSSHAILSQNSYLCGATYDYDDPRFALRAYTMRVGSYAWVCARACIEAGVNVGEGAVLGLASRCP